MSSVRTSSTRSATTTLTTTGSSSTSPRSSSMRTATTTARTRSTSPSATPAIRPEPGRSTTSRPRTTGPTGRPTTAAPLDGTTPGPCFQDYPHIGADSYGVYISTNEYDLFGPSFNAAQVFAFSKAQLAAHPASINMTLVENLNVDGSPGFTVWPATSPAGQYASRPQRHGVLPEHHRRRRLRDRQPDRDCPADRPVGADQHQVARLGLAGTGSRAG